MTRAIATVLLALSILPIALIAIPRVTSEHGDFRARYLDRDPIAAPAVHAGDVTRPPAHPGGVPVLVYHGIGDDPGSISQERFAQHMAALAAAGYETIGARDYARFVRGEEPSLPSRPILITFDDGRLDSFRGADSVLERHRFRATMFVITGKTGEGSPHHLSADELRDMRESGRWDLQPHADQGHRQVGGESFYRARPDRVRADIARAAARTRALGGGTELFAIPFSDHGRHMRPALDRFAAVFIQRDDPRFSVRGRTGLVARFEPRPDTTADDLLAWLREGAREIRKET